MRLILNSLLNLLIYNNESATLAKAFVDSRLCQIEELCMKAVRISLELAIVPIRKFLIIFYIYLRLLFGNEPHEQIVDEKEKHRLSSERIQKNKHLLYLLEYAEIFVAQDLTPRFNIKTTNPVELFYKRHMSTD